MSRAIPNLETLIEPPKTIEDAIERLCNVLSYDTQGWITGLTPEQAEWLCDSDLSAMIQKALLLNGENQKLIDDCDSTDVKSASRRIVYTLWLHLKLTA